MNDELPEGWAERTMGDVAAVVGGGTPPAKDAANFTENGGHPWLTPADLSGFRGLYVARGARNLSAVGLAASSAKPMPAGTVLMSSRAPIGYLAIAENEIATNQGFKNFVCSKALLPEYVLFWLRSINSELQDMGSGSTFAEISGARAKEIPIRVAPLAEQKRVVEKVASLLADVTRARDRLTKVPVVLKRFRQSVLGAACSGDLTKDWRCSQPSGSTGAQIVEAVAQRRAELNLPSATRMIDHEDIEIPQLDLPESWTWCRVGQIADVRLGGTPARAEASYWNGTIPWVSSGEVANCRIRATAERITQQGLANSNAKMYPRGTVLIAMIGEGKTRGQSAILDLDACTNQNAAGLVFDAGFVDPEYVWLWALGEYEKNRDVGRGGNQPALNGAKVRALPLPLPPVEEQAEIVRIVRRMFDAIDELDERVETATAHAAGLPQAILSKAFSGDLVPTEAELARVERREYEPASALLSRLADQKQASTTQRGTKSATSKRAGSR